jgi:N6-L-threonylcarbamoyladenine synthase
MQGMGGKTMLVLGIESSCDECSMACVVDGRRILSNVILSQVDFHRPYYGVVPEIASRKHAEWIGLVFDDAIRQAGIVRGDIDAIAVTNRPGLTGSLLVGLMFAKGLSYALRRPYVAVDHVLAHLHAAHLEYEIAYPYIGLLVSGGHTLIARVEAFDQIGVLGATIDDACGEAFDKVAKHYDLGFPGGAAIDRLARGGDPAAFRFPDPSLRKGEHLYDISYSGLKTAVINQLEQFRNPDRPASAENIAASFQKAAIDSLLRRVFAAMEDSRLDRLVVGGGVAANSYLRSALLARRGISVVLPSPLLCTDNGAMVAALGYHYLARGVVAPFGENVHARTPGFRRGYP